MGVLWLVEPFDADAKKRVAQLGGTADFRLTGNRLPTIDEVRAAVKSVEDCKIDGDPGPTDGRRSASIDADWDSTILNLQGVAHAGSIPAGMSLEKGSVELAASILEAMPPSCGFLFVTNDSDDEYFIVGPGVDPFDFIDAGDEGGDED